MYLIALELKEQEAQQVKCDKLRVRIKNLNRISKYKFRNEICYYNDHDYN